MRTEPRSSSPLGLSDDQLGTVAVSLVVAELKWTPDVAPAVMDRISRDAVAYPEQFDRRRLRKGLETAARVDEPTMGRTIRRIAVMVVIVALVAGLVVVAATADASVAVALGSVLSPVLEAP